MTSWADKATERLQPEFARRWVVLDPDALLLTPSASRLLTERGFNIISFRNTLGFRLEYEKALAALDQSGPLLVHAETFETDALPWDVISGDVRKVDLSIASLIPAIDPGAVRAVGPEHYDTLYAATSDLDPRTRLGAQASRDFIATHVYGIVPNLLRRPAEFWAACFRIYFRGDELPLSIAEHVSERAALPVGLSKSEAAKMLSSRATFVDRVQADWLRYAQALVDGSQPPQTLIPFGAPDIRTNFDTMVLDGAIKPATVTAMPDSAPRWAQVGFLSEAHGAGEQLQRQLENLDADMPAAMAAHTEWLAFAMRQAEAIKTYCALSHSERQQLQEALVSIRKEADGRFFSWLETEYGSLASLSSSKAPAMVHQVASHLAHRRELGEMQQALIVVDGLALDQWSVIEAETRLRQPDLLVDTHSCFAWLPTLTSVSRQAIFAGELPRNFAGSLTSTAGEQTAWKRFWVKEGLSERDIAYQKGLGLAGTTETLINDELSREPTVLGLVIDTIDEMLHGAVLGKPAIANDIREWLENGEWIQLIQALVDRGYTVYVTADHGNVQAMGIGRPPEGVAAEQRGERVRVYRSDVLRNQAISAVDGARKLPLGGLPSDYLPVFAPFDSAFLPKGSEAVVHGGTSLEEVIVPFVRITRKESA